MATVPSRVIELVETFDRNIETYKKQPYNEAQVRSEFIDPFFEELGWDITNKGGLAQAYKDVIHEDAIKIGGYTKAPDYCFRIGGTRKFFLEAKKPSIDIKGDPHPAYQLRRYAWSAKLPLSILTDFEEFAVYDCQIKPKPTDRASTARIQYFNYKDYIKKWDEIAKVFSKDAILKGSFDKFVVETKGKRGTTTVDKEFLTELEKWRRELARIIALRNRDLSIQQINFAVQRTIDRIIFLRMAEDRGIENYGQLLGLSTGREAYQRLCQVFRQADAKYNSGLFYFQKEPGRPEGPDELTLNLVLDDTPLKWILHNLYYPQCPYEFSVLPAEILGNVYEQFLGKVITLTPAHHAKVEDKPEVKKAGGIYYTPSYIVDYIVKNTVGKLCEDKEPKQIQKLRILDPACGSGSFLLGAYTYLLNYHRDWYVEHNPEKHTKQIYQGRGGQWFLTIAEKKRILLNNIFGVDIDSQAVEVTKLSLLLKVLEGETSETIGQTYKMFHERALPDLGSNIKCGNSLIGPDFFDDYQRLAPAPVAGGSHETTIPDDLYSRINPFDWKKEFPQVFSRKTSKRSPDTPQAGGFHAVIGNPPYGAPFDDNEKRFLTNTYKCQSYQLDSYLLFLERSITLLLCRHGLLGMIVPNPWLTNLNQDNTRRFIVGNCSLKEILHLKFKVFRRATVDTQIVILENKKKKNNVVVVRIAKDLQEAQNGFSKSEIVTHNQDEWEALDGDVINIFLSRNMSRLVRKVQRRGKTLDHFFDINVGMKPYQKGKGKPPQTAKVVKSRPYDANYAKDETFRPYLRGKDIVRYSIMPKEPRFISYGVWLAEPRPAANFDAPMKIFMRQTGDSLVTALDVSRLLCLNNMHVLVPKDNEMNTTYFLGLINSQLLNFYYQSRNPEAGEALAEVKKTNVAHLPIRTIDFDNPDDKAKHDKMVKLVDRMLDLHKKLAEAKVPAEKTRIQRQITTTDSAIDKLVYELYDLTKEEIAIVEGKK